MDDGRETRAVRPDHMLTAGRATCRCGVHDLHEHEVDLLLALADFAEEHQRPIETSTLRIAARLEQAEFVRRLRYLIDSGLVRTGRDRLLSEPLDIVELTGAGTLRVVAERAVARQLPKLGPRSRLSPLAAGD
jgi:hypothetical protein